MSTLVGPVDGGEGPPGVPEGQEQSDLAGRKG